MDECRKCAHREFSTQLRNVKITVGWNATQVYAVCPARMCMKCGDLMVVTHAEIGDLANLSPSIAEAGESPDEGDEGT